MKLTKKQSGSVVFYVIYFVLLAGALSAAVIGLGELWRFLARYEAVQIYHVTDAIAEQLNSGDHTLLYAAADRDISPYETEEMLKNQIDERFTGEFSLKKNLKKSTKDVPVYTVMCDEDAIAFLTLKQSGTDDLYGLEQYAPAEITGVTPVKNERVTVTYPTGCSAEINGIPLAGESVTTAPIKEAENFGDYLDNEPVMNTCTVSGLMYSPRVTFRDASGNVLPAEQSGTKYTCAMPAASGETADEAAQFALEFSEMYSKYIANDAYFSSLSGYIPQDTKLYSDLRTYEGQFYTYHTGYDFADEKVQRVTKYSDECYAVRVSYTHNVYYGETYSYPADNTIFVVSTENGWRAVALVMN